jgi:hypothetical protein
LLLKRCEWILYDEKVNVQRVVSDSKEAELKKEKYSISKPNIALIWSSSYSGSSPSFLSFPGLSNLGLTKARVQSLNWTSTTTTWWSLSTSSANRRNLQLTRNQQWILNWGRINDLFNEIIDKMKSVFLIWPSKHIEVVRVCNYPFAKSSVENTLKFYDKNNRPFTVLIFWLMTFYWVI